MADPVVVGFDGSKPSRRALAFAAGLSRPLIVAYVTPAGGGLDMGLAPQVCDSADVHTDVLRWLTAEARDLVGASGPPVEPLELIGEAAHLLGELADERSAYAVVVGRPEQRLHRVAGSVPVRLARHARCPLIVVP